MTHMHDRNHGSKVWPLAGTLFVLGLLLAACEGGDDGGGGSGGGGGTASGGSGGGGGTAGAAGGGTGGATAGAGGAGGGGGTAGGGGAGSGGGAGAGGAAGSAGSGGRGGSGGAAGAGGASGGAGAGGVAGSAALTVTSTAYMNGQTIPNVHTCEGNVDTSPPLAWTAGPVGTMAYGIVFRDMSNNLVHWVLWDIPANVTSLPAALAENMATLANPAGAKQASFGGQIGYRGPCPGGNLHTYVFTVYAVNVATLPNQVAGQNPDRVAAALASNGGGNNPPKVKLAEGTLSGTSDASRN